MYLFAIVGSLQDQLTDCALQFVTVADVKILRDIEQYYGTQIVGLFTGSFLSAAGSNHLYRMKCR